LDAGPEQQGQSPGPDAEPVLVLNVDDDEGGRYAHTRLLRQAGFTVVEAATAAEALHLVAERRPTLVLLDVNLPDRNGFEVCHAIKRDYPETLVVQLSASFTSEEDRERGLSGGADGFLFAPVEPGVMLATVRALLRLHATFRASARERVSLAALRQVEKRLELLGRATQDAVWDWDLASGTVEWNDAPQALFGYARAEVGSDEGWWSDRIHPDDRDRVLGSLRAVFERGGTKWSADYRFRRADGSYADVQDRGYLMRGEDGRPIRMVGAIEDLSERKRAERELKESEARYRLLADNATDMIFRTGLDGVRRYVSPAVREVLGYEPDDLVRLHLTDRMHPDDAPAVLARWEDLVSGRVQHQTFSYRLRHRDGHWVWMETRRRMVRDAEGRPVEAISIVRDISERVQLEERLRQAQKMEAVGQLTGGIAHDFNNLLTVILGNAELLTEDPSDPAQTYALARQILETAERGAELNQKLLAFGRRQSLKPERLQIDQIVDDMVPLLYRTIGEHIELRTDLQARRHAALSDRALLQSAILNLVVNARDAMPQGGTLTITTGERAARPAEGPLPIGQEVVFLTVADSGTGMAPDVVARAFEPFFTTKDVGKGSGLGLPMVYGFANQSGGHVSIASRVGEGTAVTIVLPAVASEAPSDGGDTPTPVPTADKEHILVVEDEPQVLQFVANQLVSLGYRVTAVTVARDALELIEQGLCFDLLFTDVVLPQGMSGVELARRARVLCPSLKVLLTSGYSEEAFEHHGRPEASTLLLRKPYRRRELAETLRRVLDEDGDERPT
jgi:PAS domain S-box-containing protein